MVQITINSLCFMVQITINSLCFMVQITINSLCFMVQITIDSLCFMVQITITSLCFMVQITINSLFFSVKITIFHGEIPTPLASLPLGVFRPGSAPAWRSRSVVPRVWPSRRTPWVCWVMEKWENLWIVTSNIWDSSWFIKNWIELDLL